MLFESLPHHIRDNYEIHEWRHASAILECDCPDEWQDIVEVLSGFVLPKSKVFIGGGNKSPIACSIDEAFTAKGWQERGFKTRIMVDEDIHDSPTHKVDCFKNGIALEIEWNDKATRARQVLCYE